MSQNEAHLHNYKKSEELYLSWKMDLDSKKQRPLRRPTSTQSYALAFQPCKPCSRSVSISLSCSMVEVKQTRPLVVRRRTSSGSLRFPGAPELAGSQQILSTHIERGKGFIDQIVSLNRAEVVSKARDRVAKAGCLRRVAEGLHPVAACLFQHVTTQMIRGLEGTPLT